MFAPGTFVRVKRKIDDESKDGFCSHSPVYFMLGINGQKRILLTKVSQDTVPADMEVQELNLHSKMSMFTVGSDVIYDYFTVIHDDGRECEVV